MTMNDVCSLLEPDPPRDDNDAVLTSLGFAGMVWAARLAPSQSSGGSGSLSGRDRLGHLELRQHLTDANLAALLRTLAAVCRRLILLGLLRLILCLGLLLLGGSILHHQEIGVVLGLLHPGRKYFLNGINLILPGDEVKHQVQLIVGEHLRTGLGRLKMLRHHVHHALGGHIEILCHFSNLIFHETAHRATSKY